MSGFPWLTSGTHTTHNVGISTLIQTESVVIKQLSRMSQVLLCMAHGTDLRCPTWTLINVASDKCTLHYRSQMSLHHRETSKKPVRQIIETAENGS